MNQINFQKFQVNEEQRSIVFSCCSDTPYTRFDEQSNFVYDQILVISEDTVDLSRLNNSAPLLYNHDVDKLIGVVDKAWIVENKIYVKVRFSPNDEFADRIYKDIIDGIIKNVSIGYQITNYEDKKENNKNIRYITNFMIYECSIVSIPADDNVGIRTLNIKENNMQEDIKKDEVIAEKEDVVEDEKDVVEEKEIVEDDIIEENKKLKQQCEELQKRIEELEKEDEEEKEEVVEEQTTEEVNPDEEEIKKIGEDFQVEKEQIERAIKDKLTVREFTNKIKTFNIRNNKKMNDKRAFTEFLQARNFDKSFTLRSFEGFGGKTGENGAALIGTETYYPLVAALEKVMGLRGYRTLSGLTSNISIPVQTGRITVGVADDLRSAVAESNPTFTNVLLTPQKITGNVLIGKELLVQSNDDVVAFIIDSLTREIAYKVEAMLLGKVAAGAGTTITYSALSAFDYADLLAFEAAISDYAVNGCDFVMSSSARAALKAIPMDSANGASGRYLIEGNEANGYAVNVSGVVGNNNIYFGDWSKLILAVFGEGLEILVNPYTYGKQGNVEIVGSICVDGAVTNADAFAIGKVQESSSSSAE